MIEFNLSPSAINLYNESQLCFYYRYIAKAKPDTIVPEVYGNAGTIVHECIERYCKGKKNFQEHFEKKWEEKKLHVNTGVDNKKLDKVNYFGAAAKGIISVKENYDIKAVEEKIVLPLIKQEGIFVRLSGIIDFWGTDKKTGDVVIIDWKTSSKADNSFNNQLKHYAYSIFKKYNLIPKKMIVEYLKIGKTKEYEINRADLLEYEDYVEGLAWDIVKKGNDVSEYEIGNVNGIFNVYKRRCLLEIKRRENGKM